MGLPARILPVLVALTLAAPRRSLRLLIHHGAVAAQAGYHLARSSWEPLGGVCGQLTGAPLHAAFRWKGY